MGNPLCSLLSTREYLRGPVSVSLFCSHLGTALSGPPGVQQEFREYRDLRFIGEEKKAIATRRNKIWQWYLHAAVKNILFYVKKDAKQSALLWVKSRDHQPIRWDLSNPCPRL